MLASNLNRLFLHTKQYHFQFPIRFFLSYLANISSKNIMTVTHRLYILQIPSFFLLLFLTCISCHSVPVGLTHVLQTFIFLNFFFCFSSASFMRVSCFCHLNEKIFWPSKVSRTSKTFSEILLFARYLFFSNATVGKNGSGSKWYLLFVIRFCANGDPPLKWNNANGQVCQFWFTPLICFFKRQRSEFHLRCFCFYSHGPINWSLWNKTVLD